jgi:hypothetical protein
MTTRLGNNGISLFWLVTLQRYTLLLIGIIQRVSDDGGETMLMEIDAVCFVFIYFCCQCSGMNEGGAADGGN